MGLYGSWLAETRSENPNTIMEKYLDKVKHKVKNVCLINMSFSPTTDYNTMRCNAIKYNTNAI